jgi:hypothetical protein
MTLACVGNGKEATSLSFVEKRRHSQDKGKDAQAKRRHAPHFVL